MLLILISCILDECYNKKRFANVLVLVVLPILRLSSSCWFVHFNWLNILSNIPENFLIRKTKRMDSLERDFLKQNPL